MKLLEIERKFAKSYYHIIFSIRIRALKRLQKNKVLLTVLFYNQLNNFGGLLGLDTNCQFLHFVFLHFQFERKNFHFLVPTCELKKYSKILKNSMPLKFMKKKLC